MEIAFVVLTGGLHLLGELASGFRTIRACRRCIRSARQHAKPVSRWRLVGSTRVLAHLALVAAAALEVTVILAVRIPDPPAPLTVARV